MQPEEDASSRRQTEVCASVRVRVRVSQIVTVRLVIVRLTVRAREQFENSFQRDASWMVRRVRQYLGYWYVFRVRFGVRTVRVLTVWKHEWQDGSSRM